MPNNNVAILSIMSKFDEKSAREAAKRADKVYEEALTDIGNVNFDKKLIENFDKAMNLLKNKFKKVNLSSYTNSLLDSIFSDKDIKEKSKDIESFISKIEMLKKASSGQDINAFNTFSAKQIDALISRTEKLAQKQEEINEKTREYNREATKIAKANRSVSTIDKNYGNQDYSKILESLKESLGTEKEFTAEQNQSIENLAKMVNLYQAMEKSEPQKGTAEAIRYSKDLLAVTQKIKEERDKIDAFSQKGASTYINDNGLSSIDKVSHYTVSKSKEDFVKSSLSNLKSQEAKLQSELTTYISESVQKNLAKVSKEVDAVVDKTEKRVENLQNKIESLQTKSTKTGSDNSIIGGIVSETDIKSLEEIEDRLYAISDLDAEGEATKQQLKEYIQLYKQYEQLVASDSTVKFDPGLKEEYDFILESDSKLKKYADTLDETISKQKELNTVKSDEYSTSSNTQTEQLAKQEEQIKETIQAEKQLQDTQEKVSSNTKISVDAEQAIADINKIKESLNSIPEEKNIKITISDSDYTNTPLLSDAEGNTITAFRGVVGAWSGLINQDGIGFFTDKLKLAADYADSLAESGKVYQANLSFKNPLEVEGNGAKWDEIDFNGVKKTTDEIVELAKQLGHDGVIFKNIRDGFTDTNEDISNVMVALNAAQIKNEQVIGTVKAGTGEMVDVASKINNATDTATNSTVESQNKIQEELKETQKIAEQVSEAISKVNTNNVSFTQENSELDAKISDVEKLNNSVKELISNSGDYKVGEIVDWDDTKKLLSTVQELDNYDVLKSLGLSEGAIQEEEGKIKEFVQTIKYQYDEFVNAWNKQDDDDIFSWSDSIGSNLNELNSYIDSLISSYKQLSDISSVSVDKSNISSENQNKQLLEGEEIRKNLYKINDEIGLSEEEFIQKLRQENEEVKNGNRQFQERLALLKDGKVVASYFGDKASMNIHNSDLVDSFDKVIHSHSPIEGSSVPSFEDLDLIFGKYKSEVKDFVLFYNNEMRSLQAPGDMSLLGSEFRDYGKFLDAISSLTSNSSIYSNYANNYLASIAEEAGVAYKQIDALSNEINSQRINTSDWEIILETMRQLTNIHRSQNQDAEFSQIAERGKELSNTFIDSKNAAEQFEISVESLYDILIKLWKSVENDGGKTAFKQLREQLTSLSSDNIKDILYGDEMFYDADGDANELKQVAQKIYDNYYLPLINGAKELKSETNSPMKDVFQGDAEKSGMNEVASATEEAVQAKKDFATANEGVQSSVDGSKSKLELESELMNQITKSAREAADAKKEFVKANTEVKASAESSNNETKKYNTEENANAWKELSYSIQRYSEVSKRISSGKILDGDVEEAERLENKISQLQKLDVLSPTQIEKSEQMLVKLYDKLDDIEKKAQKTKKESLESDVKWYNDDFEKKNAKPSNDNRSAEYTQKLAEYKSLIEQLETISKLDIINENDIKDADTLKEKLKSCVNELNSFSASQKGSTPLSRGKTIEWATDLLKQNTKWSKAAKIEVQGWIDKLATADPSNVEEIRNEILKIVRLEREAGREGRDWLDIFKEKKLYSFLGQAASMFSFYDLINVGRQGFEVIKDLDSALTEMKKVSDESTSSLRRFQSASFDVAQQVGTTALEIQNSSADFMRLGYSLENASKLAEDANIYANVGDMDISEATEHMISSIQAWQSEFSSATEASTNIIDRYNEIGNRFAITSADIGSAMERSAAALKAGGNDLNESIGLITAGNLIQQDADTTANALKVMSLRIRGAKADLESMGESSDGLADSTSKLREQIKALTGIDIMIDENTFKSTARIIQEIGAEWENLTDVSKASTLELLAGKTRASTVAGLIENYKTIDEVVKAAEESSGSAREENEKYLESINGKIALLTNNLQKLAFDVIDSGITKSLVDFGSGTINILDDIVNGFDKVSSSITSLGGHLGDGNSLYGTIGAISGLLMNKAGIGERTMFQW